MSLTLDEWWTPASPIAVGERRPEAPPLGHAGLWLDRCLAPDARDPKQKPARDRLYRMAINALRPQGSPAPAWTRRHEAVFAALTRETPGRAIDVLDVQTEGRMLLHPGANSTVTDGAVLLHHTWGVPYLPGSGLKGLARAWARRIGMDKDDQVRLFGNEREKGEDSAGYVSFLDALWIPVAPAGARDWSPLELDVVTPHHSGYLTQNGPPLDWEDPVPTQRLVVASGARFRIVLEGALAPADDLRPWLKLARDLLIGALSELGFSAWTRAGYGRLERVAAPAPTGLADAPISDWSPAELRWDGGKSTLVATLGDRRTADCAGPSAAQLLQTLDASTQTALRARKPVRVQVRVQAVGKRWRLVGVQAP